MDTLKGLIVGQFVNCNSQDRFSSIMELILQFFPEKNIPICFDAPMGHIYDNYPLILGSDVTLKVDENVTNLIFE